MFLTPINHIGIRIQGRLLLFPCEGGGMYLPRFIQEDNNKALIKTITKEWLKEVIYISKRQNQKPGWMDHRIISRFLWYVGKWSCCCGGRIQHLKETIRNSWFSFVNPKSLKHISSSFEEFRFILCAMLYKIVAKYISRRLKLPLSLTISQG